MHNNHLFYINLVTAINSLQKEPVAYHPYPEPITVSNKIAAIIKELQDRFRKSNFQPITLVMKESGQTLRIEPVLNPETIHDVVLTPNDILMYLTDDGAQENVVYCLLDLAVWIYHKGERISN